MRQLDIFVELLVPLGNSKHNISNTTDFITRLNTDRIPKRFKKISFDVKSFFTNVSIEETIDIIFNKIYDENKIETNIPQNIIKSFIFMYNTGSFYLQRKNLYSNRRSNHEITFGITVGEHICDIPRESHITIH